MPLTVTFTGQSDQVEAGFYQGNTLIHNIPLNSPFTIQDNEFSNGGYDPGSGSVKEKTSFKVKPIDPFIIDSIDVDYSYDPATGTTFSFFDYDNDGVYTLEAGTTFADRISPYDDVSAEINTVSPIEIVTPFNRVYLLTESELESVTNIPNTDPNDPDGPKRSEYVISVLRLPFKIDPAYYPDKSNMFFGAYESSLNVDLVNSDIVEVDLGEIVVSGLDNSSYDYESEFWLVLPFNENEIQLEVEQISGKTISATYLIDCYSGSLTLNVFNGGETPIHSSVLSVGRELPFKTARSVAEAIQPTLNADNGVYTAYIRQIKPIMASGDNKNLVSVEGNIQSETDYLEVEEIDLVTSAKSDEKERIISELQTGVRIK